MKTLIFSFLVWAFLLSNTGAQSLRDSLLSVITRLNTPEEQIDYLNKTSSGFNKSLQSRKAEETSLLALEIVEKNNLKEKFSKTITYLGFAYREQSRYSEARECFHKALENAKRLNQKIQIAYAYNNLASIERLLANYNVAIDYVYKSLDYFEQMNHLKGQGNCYLNLAILFNYLGKYNQALDACKKAEEIRLKNGNTVGAAIANYYFGEIYYNKGEFRKAIDYYDKYFRMYKKTKFFSDNIYKYYYMGLAGAYYELGEYRKALDYRQKALKYVKNIGAEDQLIRNLLGIGKIHIKLKNYNLAKKSLKEALKISLEKDYKNRTLKIYKTLSELYKSENNIDSAYKYLIKYTALEEEVFNTKTKEEINILEAKYKVKEKEWVNRLLQSELDLESKKNTYLVVAVLLAVITMFVAILLFIRTRKSNLLLKEMVQTKDLLFSIISHDLKNPFGLVLNTSELLIKENENLTKEEQFMLLQNINTSSKKILSLLEDLLVWARNNKNNGHNFEKLNLFEITSDAVEPLNNIAKEKSINLNLEIESSIKVFAEPNSIKTVIRNLINNAIKFSHTSNEILIKAYCEDNEIRLMIKDNGIGMSEEMIQTIKQNKRVHSTKGTKGEKGTGFGLLICNDLIKQNNAKLEIESQVDKGTTFTVIFTN